MAIPAGCFLAFQLDDGWHDCFTCLQLDLVGQQWWVVVTADGLALVHLGAHPVTFASTNGTDRQYGVAAEEVWWILTNRDTSSQSWVPEQDEALAILERAKAAVEKIMVAAPHVLAAIGPQEVRMLSNLVPLQVAELAPMQFAAVQRSDTWEEVILCKPLSADNVQWLCRCVSWWGSPFWALVKLVPGSIIVTGRDRCNGYPGLMDDQVNWMVGPDAGLLVPSNEDLQAMLAEAEIVSTQLGSPIPEHMFCTAGPMEAGLPSIEECLMDELPPEPGRFVLLRSGYREWVEVLLCKPLDPSATSWICIAHERDLDTNEDNPFYWSAVHLVQDCFAVVKGRGKNRGISKKSHRIEVDKMYFLPAPGDGSSAWAPTPKRVRKALADAEALTIPPEDIAQMVAAATLAGMSGGPVHLPRIARIGAEE